MVDTLDLANFLARNRQAGGVNAQLADALAMNLAPQPAMQRAPAPAREMPGLFGISQDRSDPGGRPRVGGGSVLGLGGILSGGLAFLPAALAGLTASDALGNPLTLSFINALSSENGDRPDRGRVSRPDRIRSASNREAGGGFVE